MLKDDKGITMTSLVIMIIVLLILASVSVTTGYSGIKEIRIGRIVSNMTMVKAKAETIYEANQFNEENLIGQKSDINSISISSVEQNLIGAISGDWYKWDKSVLKGQGLDPNMLSGDNEYFLVNYEKPEVIYSKGESLNGSERYYSLTGLKYILEKD